MQATTYAAPIRPAARWTARILGGIAILFLLFDAVIKILMVPAVVEGSELLGYPPESMYGIGLTLLACVILYSIPRTSVLGAVLLTGYLGGAVATHVRVGNPLFSHTLFPIYVAAFAWGALYLRDPRVRQLVQGRPGLQSHP